MERLLIDMDGVLANVYAQFIRYVKRDLGITLKLDDLAGVIEREAFVNHDKYVHSKYFFRNALPVEDSIETVRALNQKYEVFIISSATEFPPSLTEKMRWIERHFPFIGWEQVILCGRKDILLGDIMIDDHFKNLDNFGGKTLLFTQPHNLGKDPKSHIRVSGWKEIGQLLL